MKTAKPAASALVPGALGALLVACGGPGPYGHAPEYAPTTSESRAVADARPYDSAALQRQPEAWRRGTVSLFGVVESRSVGSAGQALLKLAVRALQPRSTCEHPGNDASCRVTVGDADYGVVWALVPLRAEDDTGPNAVGPRSLLRLVGTVAQDVSPIDGAPVIHATWYRHWPVREYVTRARR